MDFTTLVDWITNNPDWAYWTIFTVALLESLAVIGILVPGWLLLVGVGILIGTGNINYFMAAVYCFIGAVIGEYLSFAVGNYFKDRVRHWPVFQRHPDWLTKTDAFFERFGVASIALGRFVGPVRAFVPLIAGMSSMPLIRFQIINVLSAAIWAPVYLIPGVLLGASTQLQGSQANWLIANLVLLILSAWMTLVYLRNWWRLQHHDSEHEYDNRYLGVKLLALCSVTLLSLALLLFGPLSELFYSLSELMLEIITADHTSVSN